VKLKRQEIKAFRERLAKAQGQVCSLCGLHMEHDDLTLDHDHASGRVRRVLHRACNAAEGKILSWCFRSKSNEPITLLSNLIQYWEDTYEHNPVHPAHLTKEEKLIKKYRKLLRSSKRARTKQKYLDLIREVQDGITRQ